MAAGEEGNSLLSRDRLLPLLSESETASDALHGGNIPQQMRALPTSVVSELCTHRTHSQWLR